MSVSMVSHASHPWIAGQPLATATPSLPSPSPPLRYLPALLLPRRSGGSAGCGCVARRAADLGDATADGGSATTAGGAVGAGLCARASEGARGAGVGCVEVWQRRVGGFVCGGVSSRERGVVSVRLIPHGTEELKQRMLSKRGACVTTAWGAMFQGYVWGGIPMQVFLGRDIDMTAPTDAIIGSNHGSGDRGTWQWQHE
eukprot:364414-Chlamydomonas_euryale.AAC.6